MPGDHLAPCRLDCLGGGARLRCRQRRRRALENDFGGVDYLLRRLAEKHGARHRAMVVMSRRRKLEDGRLAGGERLVAPCQVRRRGAAPRGQHRHE